MLIKKHLPILLLLSVPLASIAAAAQEVQFEAASDLSAAVLLPAEIVKGDHHEVNDQVRNDGYLNYYSITSDYGEFEAVGTAMLKKRVGEIHALTELDELSKTEVFAKAAADAGLKQIKTVQQFATKPVETVKGIPAGVGRMFGRFSRQASEAVDATQELVAGGDENGESEEDQDTEEEKNESNAAVDLTESYMSVDKAARDWARKLGTDPYSSNEVLQAAVKDVAWAERLGKFGMGFASIPKIPGADVIGDVNDAVWGKDPYELRDLNHSRLTATGADESLITEYLDSKSMTPTQRTLLTAAITELEGVAGRDGILRQALNPETEAEVNFFVDSLTMLAWYHRNQNPVASVNTSAAIPSAILGNGATVLTIAVDHLYWTETIATAADKYLGLAEAERTHEVWLLGSVSQRSHAELAARNFEVHTNTAALLAAANE